MQSLQVHHTHEVGISLMYIFPAGGMAQVVRVLPNKCKALSSNPIQQKIYIYEIPTSLIPGASANLTVITTE
jgi:hypothetical protein